jgi:hypothetical protein
MGARSVAALIGPCMSDLWRACEDVISESDTYRALSQTWTQQTRGWEQTGPESCSKGRVVGTRMRRHADVLGGLQRHAA